MVNHNIVGEHVTKAILRVRKKGVLILPKSLREAANIVEGEVVAEAGEGKIVIRPFKPKVVDIDPHVVEELLSEESKIEEEKLERILKEVRG
ncbi:MAG: AbrB/MazE/SpoVT family DNA-binding domain-containing protein [Nitrososphaeria archaeon]